MKRGLVVSDIHAGSIFGMLPPNFRLFDESTRSQNPGQQYLWSCWNHLCIEAGQFNPDFIVVNGDVVDGNQRKNQGSELSLGAPRDQARAASETLSLLRQKVSPECKWYFTQGTPYHVGEWGDAEESVAEDLGGQSYWSLGTGRKCREILWLNVEGVIFEFAHHIGVSQGFYRLTQLDKEMQLSAMSGKDITKGVPKVDVVVRSHVHYYSQAGHASKLGLTTPCWQLQTRYMRKNSTTRMLPDIGGVFFEIDGAAKLEGKPPCRIIQELYHLPPIQMNHLTEL